MKYQGKYSKSPYLLWQICAKSLYHKQQMCIKSAPAGKAASAAAAQHNASGLTPIFTGGAGFLIIILSSQYFCLLST